MQHRWKRAVVVDKEYDASGALKGACHAAHSCMHPPTPMPTHSRLVSKHRIQGLLSAPRPRRIDHIVVQQRGDMDELCDLGDALLPPPDGGGVLAGGEGVDSEELQQRDAGGEVRTQ